MHATGQSASAASAHALVERLFAAAVARAGGAPILEVPPERAAFRRAEAAERRVLSDAGYAAAWEAGRRLRPEEVERKVEHVMAAERGAAPTATGAANAEDPTTAI